MKAKFSPLRLLTFELIQSQFHFKAPEGEQVDVKDLFDSYNVEVDFDHFEQDDERIRLFVIIAVNSDEEQKGYNMVAEATGLFEIESEHELDENLIGNLKYYSSLNMMINNLRNIIYQQSNLGPMGGYLLPPIDIMDLFQTKQQEDENS